LHSNSARGFALRPATARRASQQRHDGRGINRLRCHGAVAQILQTREHSSTHKHQHRSGERLVIINFAANRRKTHDDAR